MRKTRTLSLLLALVFCFSVLNSTVFATSTYTNHVNLTVTSFRIDADGLAHVNTSLVGKSDVMTEATIVIMLYRRVMLLFWERTTIKVLKTTDIYYENSFAYQLPQSGTYKCEVEYTIVGTAGEDDVILFEDTASY